MPRVYNQTENKFKIMVWKHKAGAENGRDRISETAWNLLHIGLSFALRSPL
jgi:hypothetical protein